MYRSSIQKGIEELEVKKDDNDGIEKGGRKLWTYTKKSQPKQYWLVGNISFLKGAKARVYQSLGGENSAAYVCGSTLDRKGRFQEVLSRGLLSTQKVTEQKIKDKNS